MTSKYEYAFAKKFSQKVKEKAKLDDMDDDDMKQYEDWEANRLQSISN